MFRLSAVQSTPTPMIPCEFECLDPGEQSKGLTTSTTKTSQEGEAYSEKASGRICGPIQDARRGETSKDPRMDVTIGELAEVLW